MRIPLSSPDITESEIQAVARVLRTPRLSLGPKLEEFEKAVAAYAGAEHAVAVNSGTSGLHLCIRALRIGPGDEVILPSFTFVAVANAVRYEKAVPVFVDVEAKTLNLDPAKIEAAITPRTRAILVVHTFGCPADLSRILGLARQHRLRVIEDACEALGAEHAGRKVGPLGDAGVFAFYPNKQITTGEGGMIVTQDPAVATLARALRNQGRSRAGEWLEHGELGYNYRLSEINCALGVEQMKRVESILEKREAVAREYHRRLNGISDLELPPLEVPGGRISWFVYVVRLGARFTQQQRDWIWREMASRGIGCGRYFAPIHWQPIYRDLARPRPDLAITEWSAVRSLALPFFNNLQPAEIDEVCRSLQELVRAVPPGAVHPCQ
jgi:perosamine synthetase